MLTNRNPPFALLSLSPWAHPSSPPTNVFFNRGAPNEPRACLYPPASTTRQVENASLLETLQSCIPPPSLSPSSFQRRAEKELRRLSAAAAADESESESQSESESGGASPDSAGNDSGCAILPLPLPLPLL